MGSSLVIATGRPRLWSRDIQRCGGSWHRPLDRGRSRPGARRECRHWFSGRVVVWIERYRRPVGDHDIGDCDCDGGECTRNCDLGADGNASRSRRDRHGQLAHHAAEDGNGVIRRGVCADFVARWVDQCRRVGRRVEEAVHRQRVLGLAHDRVELREGADARVVEAGADMS